MKNKPPTEVITLTQEELLEEAKFTEEYNKASLELLTAIEEERKRLPVKSALGGPLVRYLSKNGITTVTFTEVNEVPSFINAKASPYPIPAICEVSGQPAKYKDPRTGIPYATIEAFKTFRANFLKNEQAKCDQRLSQLNALLEEKKKRKVELKKRKHEAEVK